MSLKKNNRPKLSRDATDSILRNGMVAYAKTNFDLIILIIRADKTASIFGNTQRQFIP